MKYKIIAVFTSEDARYNGARVWESVINHVRGLGIAARVTVTRGMAGCYENGELASNKIEVLSFNMPIKIEIILPAAEFTTVLPSVEEMVTDGIVGVEEMEVLVHKTQKRLIPRQIRVKDVMTESPKAVVEDSSMSDVIRLLLNSEFNAVPVVDQAGHPIGIITQSDLIKKADMPVRLGILSQMETSRVEGYLETTSHKTARDVMTTNIVTVNSEKRLSEAVEIMLTRHFKRLPVVDSSGVMVGILARADVFHAITRETPNWEAIKEQSKIIDIDHAVLVRDIIRRDARTVLPDVPIEEVVRVIDSSDIQRVAVVDKENHLLGIIADSDLLGLFSDHRAGLWDYMVRRLPFAEMAKRHEEFIRQTKAKTAAEVMKTDLVTVREETTIEEAIRLMVEHRIKQLPVVDESGNFKGMVSRDSLLRAGIAHG
jgi:CBS-domain-containing membrane protein